MIKYFYIFVRQDIPLAQQIVQSNHATVEMTKKYKMDDFIPYIVLIGVPNKTWLESVTKHLKNNNIEHVEFLDTDFDFGVAAVVTVPLEDKQRAILRHYPLWKSE